MNRDSIHLVLTIIWILIVFVGLSNMISNLYYKLATIIVLLSFSMIPTYFGIKNLLRDTKK